VVVIIVVMTCNIDARGRTIRRNSGVVCCVLGGLLLAVSLWGSTSWLWLGTGIALFAAGVFQLYESRKGWCALRAMGIKTPF
jgi:hypothetical protein